MAFSSQGLADGASGERGTRGPTGPTGSVGAGRTGETGVLGSTGSYVIYADGGTGCNDLYIDLSLDGVTFHINNVTNYGAPLGKTTDSTIGVIQYDPIGTGDADLVKEVVNDSISFRTITFSNDYGVTLESDILRVSSSLAGGTQSIRVGKTGSLIYQAGATLTQGLSFGAYDYNDVEGATGQTVKGMILKNHREIFLTGTGSSRADRDTQLGTFIGVLDFGATKADLNVKESTIFHIDQRSQAYTHLKIAGITTGGFDKVSGSEGPLPGSRDTAFFASMIIDTAPMPTEDYSFDLLADDKMSGFPIGLSGGETHIVNCINVGGGNTWDCLHEGSTLGYHEVYNDKPSLRVGSCCIVEEDDVVCLDYYDKPTCENTLDGVFHQNKLCSENLCFSETLGACCTNDICVSSTEADCELFLGTFIPGVSCQDVECNPICFTEDAVPVGACCSTIGICNENLTEEQCNLIGGTYQGDFTLCEEVNCCQLADEIGACCIGDACAETTPGICNGLGGIFYGVTTTCLDVECCSGSNTQTGMCCCADGTCTDFVTESECPTDEGCTWEAGVACSIETCRSYVESDISCPGGGGKFYYEIDMTGFEYNQVLNLDNILRIPTLPIEKSENVDVVVLGIRVEDMRLKTYESIFDNDSFVPSEVRIKLSYIKNDSETSKDYHLFNDFSGDEYENIIVGPISHPEDTDDYEDIDDPNVVHLTTNDGEILKSPKIEVYADDGYIDSGLPVPHGVIMSGKIILKLQCADSLVN